MRSIVLALVPILVCGSACNDKASSAGSAAPASSTAAIPSAGGAHSARRKLPASILETKRIRVGSDISYAPLEFYKEGTQEVQGFEVDLCNAIAGKIGEGLTCDFQNDDFDKLLDDLGAGKFDIVMSAMSDHIGRQAKADFIDYYRGGMSILIKKGNPFKLESVRDLCGKSLGAQKGTDEEWFANEKRASCTNMGKAPLTIVSVKTDAESLALLKAGKLAADLEDYPAAQYTAKTSGGGDDFELMGEPNGRTPYGIAVAKSNVDLRDALVDAFKEAIEDKTYDAMIKKWGLHGGSVLTVEVNSGG